MINCQNIHEHLNQYLDKSLDDKTASEVETHLSLCPSCREYFEREVRLEKKLAEIISQLEPQDEVIWNKVSLQLQPPNLRLLKYLVPLTSAALIMIVLVVLLLFRPGIASDLLAAVEEQHRVVLQPGFHLTHQTDSPETLAELFRTKEQFNISDCSCLKTGICCNLKGGRMCSLKGRPAAHIVLNHNSTPVSLVVLSEQDLAAFPEAEVYLNRYHWVYETKFKDFNCAMIKIGNNVICAIGAVKPKILKQLLNDSTINNKPCDKCSPGK